MFQACFALVVAICMWSVMFFLQLVPWIGHFVVAVQKMLGDLAKFFIIYCFFMTPYVFSFYVALRPIDRNFSTMQDSMYSTFLAMLNIVDFRSHRFIAVALYVIHVCYVFMISILLINFLIALFSSSYSDVTNNRDITFVIQSLTVISLLEQRLVGPLGKMLDWLKRRHFTYSSGRFYITKVYITKQKTFPRVN